jgi:enamine deaminase RidA (YjgF/YER057c/UK114 family)
MPRASATAILILALAWPLDAQKRSKKKEDDLVLPPVLEEKVHGRKKARPEVTQTLEELPDPPAALVAETRKLSFHVAPMTAKGLLSQQVREGIKAIARLNGGATIVKLRAFVAGTGDLRRVQAVVSEEFSERRAALPVITVVQVGALPMEGAQVVLETVSAGRRDVNPHGLAFLSGQAVSADEELLDILPLAAKSIGQLRTALTGVGLAPADVLRATCFCSSLNDLDAVRRLAAAEYPTAALNFVQMQRGHTRGLVECEAVARLRASPGAPLKFVNPQGLPASPNYSQVALVGAGRIALSGSQMAFRAQDDDVRLAFERLAKSMEPTGASLRHVAMSSIYPLSSIMTAKVRALRFEFYDKARPPASTMLLFEGLPSLDATFAVDVVAVPPEPESGSNGRRAGVRP